MKPQILQVTATRDQIERMRNIAEYLYQLGCWAADEEDGNRVRAIVSERLLNYSANLASDIHEIREANCVTSAGIEIDPREGFIASELQNRPRHKDRVHRLVRQTGGTTTLITPDLDSPAKGEATYSYE